MNLITGHDHYQPKAADAPLEFNPDANVSARIREYLAHRRAEMDRLAAKADVSEELPGIRYYPEAVA